MPIEETPQPATQNSLQSSSYLWLCMHIPWVLNTYKLFHLNRSMVSVSNRPPPSQLHPSVDSVSRHHPWDVLLTPLSLFKSLLSTPRSSPLPSWWFNCRTQSSDDSLSDLDFIYHLPLILHLLPIFFFGDLPFKNVIVSSSHLEL